MHVKDAVSQETGVGGSIDLSPHPPLFSDPILLHPNPTSIDWREMLLLKFPTKMFSFFCNSSIDSICVM